MQVPECLGMRRAWSVPAGTAVPGGTSLAVRVVGTQPAQLVSAPARGLVGKETRGRAGSSPQLCPVEKQSPDDKRDR